MAILQPSSMSLRFESLSLPRKVSISAPATVRSISVGLISPPLHRRGSRNRSVFAFSASHEESKPSEIGAKEKSDPKGEAEESQEAWRQTLESFKEQALKMKTVSQEAYELYFKKAMVILLETAEKLKIQAEKARQDLSIVATEISEESREYLSAAAENSPEPVKDIVETFASSFHVLNEFSEVRDFYLGIPYGILLSVSGFLSFMLTGSTSGIRFGVILGGTLLAFSVSSLRSFKGGESFRLALKGQTAIATILFLRNIRLLVERPSFLGCFTSLVSGAMVAFYLYRLKLDGGGSNSSDLKPAAES